MKFLVRFYEVSTPLRKQNRSTFEIFVSLNFLFVVKEEEFWINTGTVFLEHIASAQ